MNDEHDPVDPSLGLVKLFQSEVRKQASSKDEEWVNAGEGVGHRLEPVRTRQLRDDVDNK